jgi:methyltransferase (TIGR00027 family)
MYRAMETERPDALFRDPYAGRLAGEKGKEIVRTVPRGQGVAWAMVVRTTIIDGLVRDAIAGGTDTVINLAAGLDTRPWRMELPATLRWVDVDFAGILDHKLSCLEGETPRCDYRALRADLRDGEARRAALAQATAGSTHALVITEGLLIYLTDDDVAALGRDLQAATPVRRWITDLASPRLLKWMRRSWRKSGSNPGATFQFAPEEGTGFFEPLGFKEASFLSMGEEGWRLGRTMRGMWLWRIIGMLMGAEARERGRRMSGVVVLERA